VAGRRVSVLSHSANDNSGSARRIVDVRTKFSNFTLCLVAEAGDRKVLEQVFKNPRSLVISCRSRTVFAVRLYFYTFAALQRVDLFIVQPVDLNLLN
jgi:hypothetical protein